MRVIELKRAAGLALALMVSGCVQSSIAEDQAFSGFIIDFRTAREASRMAGTLEQPLPFRNRFEVTDPELDAVVIDIHALEPESVGAQLTTDTSFTGKVRLKVVPGEIEPGSDVVQLVDGVAENVSVPIRFSYGETRIWAEDIGIREWIGGPCKTDDVCTTGLRCDGGTCQPSGCSTTMDCPVGHVCEGGSCARTPCRQGLCPSGYFCDGARCQLRDTCADTTPCPLGFACEGGVCLVDECTNGRDDDGNGLSDFPRDPTCDTGDRQEGLSPSFHVGVSPPLFFEPPSISTVQENPDSATGPSPLAGQAVEIRADANHELVVTNVVGSGFYVTDISRQNYNSIFVFNFSFPEGVSIGDRICEVSGGVVEFNALTQLQFPSWGIQGKPRSDSENRLPNPEDEEDLLLLGDIELVDCSAAYGLGEREVSKTLPLPDPVMLTPTLVRNLSAMEKLEGSVVTVEDVELSVRFVDCDDNGSTRIESGTPEASCRDECNRDIYCTELSNLFSFDQWRGVTGGAEISVSSTQLVANFDVLEGCDEGRTPEGRLEYTCGDRANPRRLKRVTGSLRQIVPTCDRFAPCDPADESIILFIIDPRFESDIVE